ncbi:hypothetical protein RP29_13885 [Acidovorax temperans]|jgi:hypothetical protein|uniref:Uncharacterized protein n=1 Tax=Acidovorax temperans TaxID=80878 RepID=A0A0D7K7J6_9BURK|nr:hypothetical protein [Acidovorax temperans]KJA09937.1 hypothetical protein RP29_13885 [Acidovorax temperans]
MSLFSWFSRKPAPPKAKPRSAGAEPSGLLNADATVPLAPGRPGQPLLQPVPPEHAANRKNERMERRELLYTVVRDAMVRAGVLSASYKFKVLSLDQRGRQFLVMMDLAREYGGETARLSEIEALIAQTAKTRYDILVTAVYWRINDHVAVGLPQKGITPTTVPSAAAPQGVVRKPVPAPVPAAPAPVAAPASSLLFPAEPAARFPTTPTALGRTPSGTTAPAPLLPASNTGPAPLAPASAPARFEPIEADEVAAFKRALADAAGRAPVAPAAAARPGVAVRSGPLLPPSHSTDFADTEMPGSDGQSTALSTTQYGELN